jgi:hypothetical protein
MGRAAADDGPQAGISARDAIRRLIAWFRFSRLRSLNANPEMNRHGF